MLKKLIYIASDDRSGSTLLDVMLGMHSNICSVGELHHLKAYLYEDRKMYNPKHPLLCSCGNKLSSCLFWKKVDSKLEKKMKDISLTYNYLHSFKETIRQNKSLNIKFDALIKKSVSKFFFKYPFLLYKHPWNILGYKKVSINVWNLCEAISRVSNSCYVVDSSKRLQRLMYLLNNKEYSIFLIHLIRNPLAVVNSKMKRGASITKATTSWLKYEDNVERCKKKIHEANKVTISYEQLCNNTSHILNKLCYLLNIRYENSMAYPCIIGKHHIGGSPSKFNLNGKIKLDNSYINELSEIEYNYIYEQTLKVFKNKVFTI